MLVELAFATLGREGYEVLLASNGDDALALVEAHGDRLALVVLDWAMPGVAGRALVSAIRARHPALAIVISSGNVEEVMRELDGFETNIHALQKPWRTRTLLALIAQLT
jgi:DNA-binding response OmpR family regulator